MDALAWYLGGVVSLAVALALSEMLVGDRTVKKIPASMKAAPEPLPPPRMRVVVVERRLDAGARMMEEMAEEYERATMAESRGWEW